MEISYNFISFIAIGNFNPAIVTPQFLNRTCKLGLGRSKELTPKDLPVVKDLEFQNLKLTVDLTRLHIKESKIEDISTTRVIDIFRVFYEKLPYTPLTNVGVNINCQLVPKMEANNYSLTEKIQDANAYLQLFRVNEIQVIERSVLRKKGEKIWESSDFRIPNVRNFTRLINIKELNEGSLNINYNYETGNLKQDPSKLDLLLNGYDEFCNEFLDFIKYLEG